MERNKKPNQFLIYIYFNQPKIDIRMNGILLKFTIIKIDMKLFISVLLHTTQIKRLIDDKYQCNDGHAQSQFDDEQ